jgi:hypothetical protein
LLDYDASEGCDNAISRGSAEIDPASRQDVGMKLQAGDRIEVKWEIVVNDSRIIHWWKATLVKYDGRSRNGSPIRKLHYEPFAAGGFPLPTTEDVVFDNDRKLVRCGTNEELDYRLDTRSVLDINEEIELNLMAKSVLALGSPDSELSTNHHTLLTQAISLKKRAMVDTLHTLWNDLKANGDGIPEHPMNGTDE